MEAQLRELSDAEVAAGTPGFVFDYVYRLDSGSNEYILVVAFESREAYRANADRPEQHQFYLQFRALLEADPEWLDGEIVFEHHA
jgi:heme-degrading monooxygenase HmoA